MLIVPFLIKIWLSEPFIHLVTPSYILKHIIKNCQAKSSPKSKSQIQVPNPSPKSNFQSPEERDWGWHYNPTG